MRLRTKIAIIAMAAFLTLAGVNLIANAVISAEVFATRAGHPSVTVEITNVRALA